MKGNANKAFDIHHRRMYDLFFMMKFSHGAKGGLVETKPSFFCCIKKYEKSTLKKKSYPCKQSIKVVIFSILT